MEGAQHDAFLQKAGHGRGRPRHKTVLWGQDALV